MNFGDVLRSFGLQWCRNFYILRFCGRYANSDESRWRWCAATAGAEFERPYTKRRWQTRRMMLRWERRNTASEHLWGPVRQEPRRRTTMSPNLHHSSSRESFVCGPSGERASPSSWPACSSSTSPSRPSWATTAPLIPASVSASKALRGRSGA